MDRLTSTLTFLATLLVAMQLHAATVKLDALAVGTYNATDFGPPAVPLVTDDAGNVVNPTVGQVYAILVTLSVTDLGTLPNGHAEMGLASVRFGISLRGLTENSVSPGWRLDQRLINLRGGAPGGWVPLWLDLCNCGMGGSLDDIAVGVDVADFPRAVEIGNPIFDRRRTVGQPAFLQTFPTPLGGVFVNYIGGNAKLEIAIDRFEVHDLEATYPGTGLAIGDTLRFVPEPATATILLLGGASWCLRALSSLVGQAKSILITPAQYETSTAAADVA